MQDLPPPGQSDSQAGGRFRPDEEDGVVEVENIHILIEIIVWRK